MAAEQVRASGAGRRWLGPIALLVVVGVVVPVTIAARAHALAIPRSDDWSYLTTLFRWVDDGTLSFNGWVSMTLIGQLVLAAPVALVAHRSITAIHLLSAGVGLVGLVAVFAVGRRLLGSTALALLVAVTIAIGPLWGTIAPTYMTDGWAFALLAVAIALVVPALQRTPMSIGLFAAALAVGFVGIAVRQYAIVGEGAMVLGGLAAAHRDRDARAFRWVLALGALAAVATVVLLVWWGTVPDPLVPARQGDHLRAAVARGLSYLRLAGLLLLPVVAAAGPVGVVRRAWRASRAWTVAVALGGAVALGASYAALRDDPFVGNYVHPLGTLADDVLAGTRPPLWPGPVMTLLVVIASASALILLLSAVPWLARLGPRAQARDVAPDPVTTVLGVTVVGSWAAFVGTQAAGLSQFPMFDRYALPILPAVAFLVLRAARTTPGDAEPRTPVARALAIGAAVVVLGVVGFVTSVDSAGFDGTRWRTAEAVVREGYRPRQVDGGFEWVAWHRGHGPRFSASLARRRELRRAYLAPLCTTVAVNPPRLPAASRLLVKTTYWSPARGRVTVVATRNARPCATPPRP